MAAIFDVYLSFSLCTRLCWAMRKKPLFFCGDVNQVIRNPEDDCVGSQLSWTDERYGRRNYFKPNISSGPPALVQADHQSANHVLLGGP